MKLPFNRNTGHDFAGTSTLQSCILAGAGDAVGLVCGSDLSLISKSKLEE